MFVLKLKNPMVGFPEYVCRREGNRIYFDSIFYAKTFKTEEEAVEFAGNSMPGFDTVKIPD
jgi:hypothetical protein